MTLTEALYEIERLRAQLEESAAAQDEMDRLTGETLAGYGHEVEILNAAVARLSKRWEALKTGVDDIHAHWSSFHSVAPSAVANVQRLIASLENQP